MTSIVCVGDIHLSDKPPTNCTDQYNEQLFTMLAEIVSLSAEHDAVVFAGDIFHAKRPDRTSHRTVQRMIEVVQAFPCPVFLVPGNHDMQYDRLDSIHETQPFGTLLRAGARLLDGWAEGWPLYGVPWQQDWQNAGAAFEKFAEAPFESVSNGRYLLVTHAPIYPLGEENPWENIPAATVAAWMQHGDNCYYGHVHDYHGVFTVDGVTFCNQGAVSRGSLQEEDLNRKPAVTIWTPEAAGTPFFRVELTSAPPASEVFRIAEAVERVDHRQRLEEFLSAVGRSEVSQTSVEAVLSRLRSLDLSEADRRLAEEVLTAAAAGELK